MRPRHKPAFVQCKPAITSQPKKAPVAPPVYRPQPTPTVLQRTVRHPEIKRIAQPKMVHGRPPAIQPKAPPIYRPPTSPLVRARMPVQRKTSAVIQRVIDESDLPTIQGLNRQGVLARMRNPQKREEPGELATAWLKANLPEEVRLEKDKENAHWAALLRDSGVLDQEVELDDFEDDEEEEEAAVVPVAKAVVPVAVAAVAAPIAGKVAAAGIIKWLKDNGYGGDTNYTVGVLKNNNLMISKVNGVTKKTKAMAKLALEIVQKGYHRGRRIYLAQKFNTALGSNHAEMCILAAAGSDNVSYMLCTGPHCPYCADTMEAYGVEKGNGVGGEGQQGWAHPFYKVSYGTQVSGKESSKRAELKKLHDGKLKEHEIVIGAKGISAPRGASIEWVFG